VLNGELAEGHRRCEGKAGLISRAALVARGNDAAGIKSGDRALPLMHHLAFGIGQQSGRIPDAGHRTRVCTENLNSNILVMKSAKDRA
jgi:hypothetical protein